MTMTTRRTMTAAFTLALAVGLSACGADETEGAGVQAEQSSAPAAGTADEAAGTDDADDSDDSDDSDDAADSSDDTDDSGSSAAGSTGDVSAVLAAIKAAEAEVGAGSVAYEIDDQDSDGSWEVDVFDGKRSIEVRIAEDGSVQGSDDDEDMDDDDRTALESATVTLAEAITAAVDEVGGVLDDAELDEEDGTYSWKVEIDGTDRGDDLSVRVDLDSGKVLSVG